MITSLFDCPRVLAAFQSDGQGPNRGSGSRHAAQSAGQSEPALGQAKVHRNRYPHGDRHTVLHNTWAKAPFADRFDGLLVQTVTQAPHNGHPLRLATWIDGQRYQDDPRNLCLARFLGVGRLNFVEQRGMGDPWTNTVNPVFNDGIVRGPLWAFVLSSASGHREFENVGGERGFMFHNAITDRHYGTHFRVRHFAAFAENQPSFRIDKQGAHQAAFW